jgi:large subunit ribosomal protein L17
MRHRKVTRKLNRTASHRNALVSNMATSLFEHKQIKTTTAKAKEIRKTVEKMITFAKGGSLANRRQVLKTIRNKKVVKALFDDIAPTYNNRNGGYTRVIKLGKRKGDGAELALLELVGYEGALLDKHKTKEEEKAKRKKKKEETVAKPEPQEEKAEE